MSSVRAAPDYLLPVEAYTGQEWFEREQRELFAVTWRFAGMTDELAAPGDYLTVDAGDAPLIVIRGHDGQLAAFHNVCRHRGARLLEGRGNVGRELRCFYHAWTYGLDGRLKRVPQAEQFPDLDRDRLGLVPAAVDTWRGLVFAHADAEPDPLIDWLGALPDAIGPYEPDRLGELYRESFEVAANWKLFTENHIDGYHLWHLHARSVTGFAHARQRWRSIGRHWTLQEPPLREGTSPTAGLGLSPIPGLHSSWYGSTVHLVFPNLGLASGAEYFITLAIEPLAPDRTRVDLRFRAMPLTDAARWAYGARHVAESVVAHVRSAARRLGLGPVSPDHSTGTGDINAEDKRAAEAVQAGMRSPMFEVTALARDYEAAISQFQHNVADYVPVKVRDRAPR